MSKSQVVSYVSTTSNNNNKNAINLPNKSDYKGPLRESSISLVNSIDRIETQVQPLSQVVDQAAVANASFNSRMSTNTSHNSISLGSTNKFKSKNVKKDPKIRDLLLQDERQKKLHLKKMRKHDIQKLHAYTHNHHKTLLNEKIFDDEYKVATCRMTFIFDPNGRLSYWMGFIVSLAFLYNFWVIVYRYTFNEINSKNKIYWFAFDYFADFLYICDILFNFRTGFLEEGVLQTDPVRLRHHYMNTTRFYVDCLCLLPLDILYLSIGYNSILRCFRLVKLYRFWGFLDRTERHTNFPNVFRTLVMLHYLFAIFHWNACVTYFLSRFLSDDLMYKQHHLPLYQQNNELQQITKPILIDTNRIKFKYKNDETFNDADLINEYLKAFYLSTKLLTMIHEIPNPKTSLDYLFSIFQLTFALLLFATIMGHVGYIVSNLGNARKEFQSKLDAVKTYMSLRRVPERLQDRVIRWFDFLWTNHKSIDDNQVLNLLPYKLRAEIAIHVHLDTLKRVEIFQNTEAGFLNELVLRLKPVLYSPGDYICRKGEVGKEMYIVNGGKLQVISDNGKIVLATLKAGSYFGEISILNMGASGNRRTASVKSVGYSDLFCLLKEDLWEVLKEYPAVRVKLEAIAVKRLENHKKPLSEIVNMSRCKSAPILSEPNQTTEPQSKFKRHGTLPTSLLKRTDIPFFNSPESDYGKKNRNTKPQMENIKTDQNLVSPSSTNADINTKQKNVEIQRVVDASASTSTSYDESISNLQSTSLNTPLVNLDDTQNETNFVSNLVHQVESLRKKVQALEVENVSLNHKLKNKTYKTALNNRDYCKIETETNLTPKIAKPETDSEV